ncbi:LolA family protein [Kordiimonas marina]|uniref:LolA family protein n=1 Tax=Kordiimonas marina TaxID=2872312 RepID=UPI001FF41CA2|nr:outer membrane lipoprotein carrier protein LolA [Kordiimonas marina]MCJ9429841.1 outer membrane lipoprotein carrier protein LolA [Kordiimonas marina]
MTAGPVLAEGAPPAGDAKALPPVEEQTVPETKADRNLEALRRVQTYMDQVNSLKASFTQRAPDGKETHGTLYMERPGKVRFDYTDGTPFLVVADGKTLSFVDYEVGQVTKWPVKDTPLKALLGHSVDLASVNAHIELNPAGIPDMLALSAQDADQPEQGQITIYFKTNPGKASEDKSGLQLLSWSVVDARGGLTYVKLSNESLNLPLDKGLWTFKDPRGVAQRHKVH